MTLVILPTQAALTKLDVEKARDCLARCHDVDEAKSMRDKADAIAIYLRTRGAGIEAQNYAAEIALRAERRLGELTRELPKARGIKGRFSGGTKAGPPVDAPTLADQGITKNQSSRWQALASIPEKRFEEHVERVKAKAERLTTSGALSIGKPPSRPEPRDSTPSAPESSPEPLEWNAEEQLSSIEDQLTECFKTWRLHEPDTARLVRRIRLHVSLEEKCDENRKTRGVG